LSGAAIDDRRLLRRRRRDGKADGRGLALHRRKRVLEAKIATASRQQDHRANHAADETEGRSGERDAHRAPTPA
jgi:hypothetical protein